ncbi:MAG: T9SS type A sorting domain-containing protein [Saprospiraceae bacterium]
MTVNNLSAGDYLVYIKTFNVNWQTQCDKNFTVSVTGDGGGCDDDDNDGVCNADDCRPNNPNRPTTPGTSCNDGNANTINDVIQSDGCTCAGTPDTGCDDDDNDGVCNADDCEPNNPNRPTTPGASCNDGNANTINDVIQSDGCTCQGEVDNGGGGTCADISIVGGDSRITISNFSGYPHENIQIWTPSWSPTANCVDNCGDPYVLDNLSSGTYFVSIKTFNASWGQECNLFEEISVGGSACPDSDNDGICDDEDCAPRNPNFPVAPGTACDDGDSNTINDVIISDGCTCRGSLDGCNDDDNDGYCNPDDCAPNNPNLPAQVGSTCDDGNANTVNDVIQSDGCTCQGEADTGGGDCNITVTTAPGQIQISGVDGIYTGVKVYDPSWQEIFDCSNNCSETIVLNNLSAGTYYVDAKNFTAAWTIDCRNDDYYNVPAANNLIPATPHHFGAVVIFPNPARDILNVRLDLNDNYSNELKFYDSFGRVVFFTSDLKQGEQLVEIPVEHLPKGIYLVHLESAGQVLMTKRVVVQ